MISTAIIGHVLAVGIGLSLGILGGGGSILAVPILIYVMGVKTQTAIATSLAVVGVVSLIGAMSHLKKGNVNLRATALFTPAAMAGTYLGARLTTLPYVNSTTQLLCFGTVMLGVSILMIRKESQSSQADAIAEGAVNAASTEGPNAIALNGRMTDESTADETTPPHAGTTSIQPWPYTMIQGLIVGALTGFAGIGGGFLVTPALVLLVGIPIKEAIGTALLIIAAKSGTGFLGYVDHVTIDWGLLLSFSIAASFGKVAGLYISQFLDAQHLRKGLGYVVSVVAILVLTQAIAF